MALATQCPHCRTIFRVVPDQLKLRAGLVRCGACKQIFNGLEQLLPPEEETAAPAPGAPVSAAAPDTAPSAIAAAPAETPAGQEPPASPSAAALSDDFRQPGETNNDPLLRMTLMDFSEFQRAKETRSAAGGATAGGEPDDGTLSHAEEESAAELNQDIENLQHALRNDPKRAASLRKMEQIPEEPAPEVPEPDFVQQARRQARIGRSRQIAMRAATVLLSISLVGQAVYAFRDQLAVWLPQSAPLLAQGCAVLGCTVGLPAQIDSVSIESSELQALASSQDTFVLVTLLRNRSATPQTWPHIELTLNDPSERAIVRRVIGPREYLPSTQEIAKGLAANSEQPVKIFFELAQLKASGYRVYLFYP